jgi:adenylate cyclase class 2
MNFEVEQKHPVEDLASLEAALKARGCTFGPPVQQVDVYFNHPARDFAETDEALRIRTVGAANYVTYKGPKLDRATKIRRELELPLEAGDHGASRFADLLLVLGFTRVADVRKTRRTFKLATGGFEVEGAIDEVQGLHTFVELECMTDEAGVDNAQREIATLAEELGLGQGERRSYLELLLAR